MEKSNTEPKTEPLNYNSLIKKVKENGDLVILGMKGTAKTTLLVHLVRQLRREPKNRKNQPKTV